MRLVDTSGTASLASGTNRIDNILVTGTAVDTQTMMIVSFNFQPTNVSAPPPASCSEWVWPAWLGWLCCGDVAERP